MDFSGEKKRERRLQDGGVHQGRGSVGQDAELVLTRSVSACATLGHTHDGLREAAQHGGVRVPAQVERAGEGNPGHNTENSPSQMGKMRNGER